MLLLGGCTTASTPAPTSSPGKKTAIPAGADVTLQNGLTLKVPAGWTATLTVNPSPDGPLSSTEYLLLENWGATDGPKTLMAFSSSAATLAPKALDELGRDSFSAVEPVGDVQLFVGRPGTPYEPKRLMTAITHVPSSALGVLFFAGYPDDPEAALTTIWDLFEIRGTTLK